MKLGFHKLIKSLSEKSGSGDKEHSNSLGNSTMSVISQEYKAAIRTSSYEEMWSRVQIQLTRSTSTNLLSSSSPPNIYILHLSDDTLLQPSAEITLDSTIKTLDLHHLIVNFFEASSKACNVCELLLRNIHKTRTNYCDWIKRAVELSRLMMMNENPDNNNTRYYEELRVELATFVSLRNPLGFISSAQFHEMHDENVVLLHRLVKKGKKISRKMKTLRICKKVGGCCVVGCCGVLGVITLVIAAHTIVGIAAAPGILFPCLLGLEFSKNPKSLCNNGCHCDVRKGEKLRMQLDAAAKWLFVLVNDMDTVGSLVEKVYSEMEHSRARVDLGLKNQVMLREVVKQLDEEKMCLMEQLEELEQHIYLCLVTINKSRRSLLDETTKSSMHTAQGCSGGDD